jgi:hypothetical protein
MVVAVYAWKEIILGYGGREKGHAMGRIGSKNYTATSVWTTTKNTHNSLWGEIE